MTNFTPGDIVFLKQAFGVESVLFVTVQSIVTSTSGYIGVDHDMLTTFDKSAQHVQALQKLKAHCVSEMKADEERTCHVAGDMPHIAAALQERRIENFTKLVCQIDAMLDSIEVDDDDDVDDK